ncbi:MAG: hypothetical protein JSR31_07670 [Nitrospira sp.]|nr:hypothetical protein [Nitrospira sp.]
MESNRRAWVRLRGLGQDESRRQPGNGTTAACEHSSKRDGGERVAFAQSLKPFLARIQELSIYTLFFTMPIAMIGTSRLRQGPSHRP